MKLIKCRVHTFGGLKDVEFNFNDTLNSIKEDNGYGKSTLTVFIKSMFYGLSDSKRNVDENERLKFKPRQSVEKFGGHVDFEWGGKLFRIERFFGNKSADDTVTLKDLETGKVYERPEDLGKRIFSIDEEGFFSTTYFSQKDFEVKSTSSLTAKYNSVCGETLGGESFDKATKTLEDKLKEYKMRGDKGLIADKKRERYQIEERISEANKASEQAEKLKADAEKIKEQLIEIKKQTTEISDKISIAGKNEAKAVKLERLAEIEERKSFLSQRKAQILSNFNGKMPDVAQIDAYKECYSSLTNVKSKEELLYNQLLENQKNNQGTTAKSNLIPVIIAIVICMALVAGVALFFYNLIAGIAVLLASLVVGLIFLVWYRKKKIKDKLQSNNVERLRKEFVEYKNIREKYQQNLDLFFASIHILEGDYVFRFSTLNTLIDEYYKIIDELTLITARYDKLKAETSREGEVSTVAENVDQLQRTLTNLQYRYGELANERARLLSALNSANEIADRLPDLQNKLTDLKAEIERLLEEYEVYSLTLDFLKKADENLKIKYRRPLEESLNKYYTLLSNDTSKNVSIDVDLRVTVNDVGGSKDTAYYSKGYRNLFEICKRFALIDVLFTQEKPFIILDDPFCNLDDGKLSQALSLVKRLSQEYQILYLVCHESRRA